jgi:Ca2+-transporting ATPase
VLALIAGLYAYWQDSGVAPDAARTMAFVALIGGNLGLIVANRSLSETIGTTLRVKNVPMYLVAASAVTALALTVYWPPLQHLFGFATVSLTTGAACFAAGVSTIVWFELLKRVTRGRAVVRHASR